MVSSSTSTKRYAILKSLLVTAVCLVAIARRLLDGRRKISSSLSLPVAVIRSSSPTIVTSTAHNITAATTKDKNLLFETVLWPRLRETLCPLGVPDVSLGKTLFALGRTELGLEQHPNADSYRGRTVTDVFFNGGFGYTVFIDGEDPTSTVFYAPIWKCANDQIHSYLHQIFNRKPDGRIRRESALIGNVNDFYMEKLQQGDISNRLFYQQWYKNETTNDRSAPSNNNGDGDDDDDDDDDDDAFYFTFNHTKRDKPCLFTVIRDPISHFLSGYNEIEYRLITEAADAPPVERYGDLPSYSRIGIDRTYDATLDRSTLREERFEEFVRNILQEHPSFVEFDYYKHVAPMSRILPTLTRLGLLETHWYLPTLENLTETFPSFLANRCPKIANSTTKKLPPMPVRGKHASSNDTFGTYKAAKDVWKKAGPISRSLCYMHAMDYACYSDLVVPPLCREVYATNLWARMK